MSFPAGVTLRQLTFGSAIELETGDNVEMRVTIKASRSMVWNGVPVVAIGAQFTSNNGLPASVTLPVTDQVGWQDGAGGTIDVSSGRSSHTYTAVVEYFLANVSKGKVSIGPFMLPTGDLTPVDMDNLVPASGPSGVIISTPDIWTAQINDMQAQINALGGGGGVDIHSSTAKATPIDGDEMVLADSADSYNTKKFTLFNLKNVLDASGIAKLKTARNINGVPFDGTANITVADSTKVPTSRQVNGHPLSADVVVSASDITTGILPAAQLPPIAVVSYAGDSASQAAMLALTAQSGDWTVRTDLGTVFVCVGDPTQVSGWKQLSYPTAPVTSVASKTGAVTLVKGDVGLGSVDNTADAAKAVLSATKLTTARTINGQSFDGTANIDALGLGIHAATAKATPVDADELGISDSAAANAPKRVTLANLRAFLTLSNIGQPTANVPFNGKKFTGMGAGSVSGDSVNYDQLIAKMDNSIAGLLGVTVNTLIPVGWDSAGSSWHSTTYAAYASNANCFFLFFGGIDDGAHDPFATTGPSAWVLLS